ncbi:MAG: hypothetical protein LBT73_00655, partial [Tannerellaceae bacterium]|nr:hypothetical protein [Tannerellaceae bacterium]
PGEYNQHQTLLSLNLKWECISDLVTVAKTLDGTYAITPKPGSGGGGAGGKLVITVNADPTLPNLPAPVGLRSSGEEEAAVPVEAAEVSFIILKGAVVEEPAVEAEGEEETVVEAEVEGEPEGEGETEVVEEGEPEAVEPEEEATPEPEPEPVEEAPVVEAVSAPPVGTLEVVGGGEASYTVYTLSGRAVSAPLKAGLYIVKGEKGRVGKVVVR